MEKSAPKAWTEAEKTGLLFQIIEQAGTIPWDNLKLPEGRTKKACVVMIDKEKQKVKKARAAEQGEGDGGSESTEDAGGKAKGKAGGKRKSKDDGDGTPKKKSPRKKKVTGEDEAPVDDEEKVKEEVDEDALD